MSYIGSLNASTLLAQASLTKGTERAAVSMERLSTGVAVASAKDDPSAYYAGSTLGARIAWESQATKNISDTSSLLNAADGAIEQVKTMLQRIRVLAMQAANATAELDRNLLQAEVDQLTTEIDRLTQTTVYNGQRLLQGEQDHRQFQVGGDARDLVAHRFSGFRPNEIGAFSYLSQGENAFGPAASSSDVTRTAGTSEIKLVGNAGDLVALQWPASASADAIATQINAFNADTGVMAESETRARLSTTSHSGQIYSLKINGTQTANFNISSSDVGAAVDAINKISGETGVEASQVAGELVLVDKSGADMVIENTRRESSYNTLRVQKLAADGVPGTAMGTQVSLDVAGANDTILISGSVELVSSEAFAIYNQGAAGHFLAKQQRALQQDTEIDFRRGALSLVDGKMYRGDGETAEVVALVDTGTTSLESGSLDLKFAFGIDDALPGVTGSDPFRSWEKIEQRVVFDGTSRIGNHAAPQDLTLPNFANGLLPASGDAAYPEANVAFSFQQVSDDDGNDGKSLELKSGPISMPNVGIVHGPALQSAQTYNLEAGDVLSFDWRGVAGAGDYDVMAYIVDESTGHTEELLNATGQGTASSSWATVNKTIEKDGDYRVVFVSGVRSDKEVTFENGTFENGSAGDTSIPGWTTYTQQLRLGGLDTVAGQPTPGDTVFPATVINAAPHDGAAPSSANYAARLSNNSPDGGGLSVQLQSTGVSVQGFGILHGPYLVSNEAMNLKPGDSVSFDWQATGGSDAYDVIGYLVDETTGEVQELLNETGATGSASTNWATVTQTVSKQGSYKFVFVAGTWDASGGSAAGANLYVDNVVVDSSEQIVQADAALRIDEVVITKDTANIDEQELNKLIDRLYGFEEDGGRIYDLQRIGNRIEIDSKPIVAELESVDSIDVRTATGANSALTILDQALAFSADRQAGVSALSQSVDYRMERLLDRSLQMETARGRIVDADFALESALLAKEEMIKQLAGFVLTNTNEILRSTLNLLR